MPKNRTRQNKEANNYTTVYHLQILEYQRQKYLERSQRGEKYLTEEPR